MWSSSFIKVVFIAGLRARIVSRTLAPPPVSWRTLGGVTAAGVHTGCSFFIFLVGVLGVGCGLELGAVADAGKVELESALPAATQCFLIRIGVDLQGGVATLEVAELGACGYWWEIFGCPLWWWCSFAVRRSAVAG